MKPLGKLDRAVLDLILDDNQPCAAELRDQLEFIEVGERTLTGKGFWTHFDFLPGARPADNCPDSQFGGVGGVSPEIKNGVGFLLLVRNGWIESLEGFAYGESWPSDEDKIEVGKIQVNKSVRFSSQPLHPCDLPLVPEGASLMQHRQELQNAGRAGQQVLH